MATLIDTSAPLTMRPTTLMLSGESTGTALPSRVRHSGIRVETRAGHGAGKPLWMQIEDFADQWAFAAQALQIPVPTALQAAGAPPSRGREVCLPVDP